MLAITETSMFLRDSAHSAQCDRLREEGLGGLRAHLDAVLDQRHGDVLVDLLLRRPAVHHPVEREV